MNNKDISLEAWDKWNESEGSKKEIRKNNWKDGEVRDGRRRGN